jgi:hypothetical protein
LCRNKTAESAYLLRSSKGIAKPTTLEGLGGQGGVSIATGALNCDHDYLREFWLGDDLGEAILEEHGSEVLTASNGLKGLAFFRKNRETIDRAPRFKLSSRGFD